MFANALKIFVERLLEYINLYYRLHVPNFPELKSLAVLKDLFAH